MPNKLYRFSHLPPDPVARVCDVTKHLFNAARGNHETDADTIDAIARSARLPPSRIRSFLVPSRRPKDVSVSIWERLVAAYRRQLERQLADIQLEIRRCDFLGSDDRAMVALLDKAKALVSKIEALTAPPGPRPEE